MSQTQDTAAPAAPNSRGKLLRGLGYPRQNEPIRLLLCLHRIVSDLAVEVIGNLKCMTHTSISSCLPGGSCNCHLEG